MKGKIEAISGIKEFQGKLNIGFRIEDNWYNITGTQAELDNIRNTLIKKGNEIEFEAENKMAKNIKVISEAAETGWQEDIIDFATLLNEAHKQGLTAIHTENLVIDLEKRYALFKAIATGKKGSFEAHGDVTAENITGEFIRPHWIRMAETRSIARALRWYTNNASTSDVEVEKVEYPKVIESKQV